MASRNKSRGLDPTGTMPLSAVAVTSSSHSSASIISTTNNNISKYSNTTCSAGGGGFSSSRLTSPSTNIFDNHLEEDMAGAKYELDKVFL